MSSETEKPRSDVTASVPGAQTVERVVLQKSEGKKPSMWVMAVLYSVVIIGVMIWSGGSREVIVFDGLILRCNNCAEMSNYYQEVFGLTPFPIDTKEQDKIAGFFLPDGKKLWLIPQKETTTFTTASYVLLVRSGFRKLHARLVSRSKEGKAVPVKGILERTPVRGVSEVVSSARGQEFAVKDPEGNLFVFFH